MKKCPDCAEEVRAEARKCRFCGYMFDEAEIEASAREDTLAEAFKVSGGVEYPHTFGPPKKKDASRLGLFVLALIGIALAVSVFSSSRSKDESSVNDAVAMPEETMMADPMATDEAMSADPMATDEAMSADPMSMGTSWSYNQVTDEVRNAKVELASLTSTNSVNLSPPYDGGTSAIMTVRQHPEHGLDVFFTVSPGQLMCDISDGCSAQVNVDGKVSTIALLSPSDHDSQVLFLASPQPFVEMLKKAKKVVIELELYQEGRPQWNFDTAGLDWPRKRSPS